VDPEVEGIRAPLSMAARSVMCRRTSCLQGVQGAAIAVRRADTGYGAAGLSFGVDIRRWVAARHKIRRLVCSRPGTQIC
jgi:hypothetical protein